MAPRTRSSAANTEALATAEALQDLAAPKKRFEGPAAKDFADPPKRGRGRPRKSQPVVPIVVGSDSASSAPTPLASASDGEYSTPATSNAVTPAPPTKDVPAIPSPPPKSSTLPRRGRLTLEFPDDDTDEDGSDTPAKKSTKATRTSTMSRPTRQRRSNVSYVEDSDEYDVLYGEDQSASATLARQLQREEDQKASRTSLSVPIKRTARACSFTSDSDGGITLRPNKTQKTTTTGAATKLSTAITVVDSEAEVTGEGPDELSDDESYLSEAYLSDPQRSIDIDDDDDDDDEDEPVYEPPSRQPRGRRRTQHGSERLASSYRSTDYSHLNKRARKERQKLEKNHPVLQTMWSDLENMPDLNAGTAAQPTTISLQLKPFQLQGLAWMKAMEQTPWGGGLLGDEMGLGKTIQAVSLIMSDYPAKAPTLVLLPPVALGQWQDEIAAYTGNRLKTIVFHGTNAKAKNMSAKDLKKFDVIIMSYNSLESLYRRQEKGIVRKEGLYKEKSPIHQIRFHRVILDEAHCIKVSHSLVSILERHD